jgi:hypothetical protein
MISLRKMRHFLIFVVLIICVSIAQAATLVVNAGNSQGWILDPNGAALPPTFFGFTTDYASIGTGSYKVILSDTNSKIRMSPPLSITAGSPNLLSISWDNYVDPASPKVLGFYVNVYVDRAANGIGTFSNVFYDCRFDFQGGASAGTWQPNNILGSTVAVNVGGSSCPGINTLDNAALAGDSVLFVVFNAGDQSSSYGDSATPGVEYIGAIDNVVIKGTTYDFDAGSGANGQPIIYFTDGRLNPHLQAPAIVYCFTYGIQIYEVRWLERARGQIMLFATEEDIAAVPEFPEENTLIKQNGIARLYRLTSGEFQLNYGPYRDLAKPIPTAPELEYEFRWRNCSMFPSVRKIWDINTGETTLLELIPNP